MKNFVLSAFSIALTVSAVAAPSAQAFPQGDSSSSIHTLRLREMDIRNKSEDDQLYYPYTQTPAQTPAQSTEWTKPESATVEGESVVESEAIAPQADEAATEEGASATSLTARRLQVLDRN